MVSTDGVCRPYSRTILVGTFLALLGRSDPPQNKKEQMTHEELLAELDALNDSCSVVDQLVTVLRAVVELHRPALDNEIMDDADNETLGCAGCGFDFNYGTWEVNYPCQTIRTIQEELA